jgi:methionine sulfoxide reductase heme-binding subunit
VLLLAALAVTPIRRLSGWNALIRVRRPLGVFAFGYATLHLLTFVALDHFFAWPAILEDIVERPFITVGFVAFLLLAPLAATSTRPMIRRLGRNWQRLHRLVYPAGALAALHFYWKAKADTREPLIYAGVLALLLCARLWSRRRASAARTRPDLASSSAAGQLGE